MPIPSASEVQGLATEIQIAGEDFLHSLVDVVSKARPRLIDLLNLSPLVAMPRYSQAVGGVTWAASG